MSNTTKIGPMADRHLFACGGGSFFGGVCPKLESKMREASGKPNPKVLYIPTASGDPKESIARFKASASQAGYQPETLALFDTQSWSSSPEEMIGGTDIIWVGGGSTFNMLRLWEAWGIIPFIRTAYEKGVVLGGVSAGAICWFEQGNTDSLGPGLGVINGLNWLKGSCTPHYDSEELRKPILARQLSEGAIKDGIAIDEGCTVYFLNEELNQVISETESACAYRVSKESVSLLVTSI